MLSAKEYKKSESLSLDKGWEFAQVGRNEWLPATVPGTVHQDLISHNKLPNPFYGMNEQKVQWVENEDWVYKTTFNVTDEQLSRDAALLILEGLDTYADIYLNGSLLERTDNMFVGYTLPVKEVLRKGENHLQILFHSPVKQTLPQWETNGFDYPADNDHSDKRVSIYSRKAPYSYGWDWGIRLVTSGIWRPVTLTFYDVARIDDYYVRQASVTKDLAKVENRLTVNSVSATPQKAEVTVAYSYKEGEKVTEQKEVTLQPGTNHILLPIEIRQPHLWMPNGWGEPALYDFEAVIKVDGKVIASQKERIGLRTIKVVNIHATTQLKVVLVKPDRFENASEIADQLKDKRTVVLNLESTNKDVARRLIDFLSGVAYAGEGKIKKVAANTYIITPYHVELEGDLIDELESNGLYF